MFVLYIIVSISLRNDDWQMANIEVGSTTQEVLIG